MTRLFITASGTGIGKTLVTAGLCHQLRQQGRDVTALKPVISGFEPGEDSDSAILLSALGRANTPENISAISPWQFKAPLSPHLAAKLEARSLELDPIVEFCRNATADIVLTEGVGGVMVPLNHSGDTTLHWMQALNWPVLVVSGSYLGAISHTLTALESLARRGLKLTGIAVSQSEHCAGLPETAATLRLYAPQATGQAAFPVLELPRVTGSTPWRDLPPLQQLLGQ